MELKYFGLVQFDNSITEFISHESFDQPKKIYSKHKYHIQILKKNTWNHH